MNVSKDLLRIVNKKNLFPNPCLFYNDGKSLLLIVYVDDGIIISNDEEIAKQFLKKLETEFCVTVEAANH